MLQSGTFLLSDTLFWFLLLSLSLITAMVGLGAYFHVSRRCRRLRDAVAGLGANIRQFPERTMDHREMVISYAADSRVPELEQGIRHIFARADADFAGKWIPDPAPWLDSVQGSTAFRIVSPVLNVIPALTGLLSSSLLVLLPVLGTGGDQLPAAGSIVPILLGLLLSYLLGQTGKQASGLIAWHLSELGSALEAALPVYSSDQASRILVDRFVAYNDELSRSVNDLAAEEIVSGVGKRLEELFARDIIPHLQDNTERLSELASDLSRKQDQGMRELAGEFSNQVAVSVRENLAPITDRLGIFSELAAGSQASLAATVAQMTAQFDSLSLLQVQLTGCLETLKAENAGWSDHLTSMNDSLARLAIQTERMADAQSGAQGTLNSRLESLGAHLDNLGGKLNTFSGENFELIQKLAAANSQMAGQLQDNSEENLQLLRDYRSLSDELVRHAAAIETATESLSQHMSGLNETLDGSVRHFTSHLETAVSSTIDEFDKGLSEMSLRLSHTAAELRDSVSAVRGRSSGRSAVSVINPRSVPLKPMQEDKPVPATKEE